MVLALISEHQLPAAHGTRSKAVDYKGNAIITALLSASPSKSASDCCRGRLGQKQQLFTLHWLEEKEQTLHLTLPSLQQEGSSLGPSSRLTPFTRLRS